ncbi:peptide ABC transporter substrate-binding protein [Oceanivirga miroungae]|uniref:Family 5 extracellular solute-binding protein n=1 Tax=Oceanivirga miroungae TaxID=1130046 RepID=A0A6I8MD24_9FUSO|nr:peptide ABC transporter substrate-binding protein [Oceanivirga miroungae]VWL84998.1 family 5 extracellular solute-binding protein [Oceanivirga miroungae]
MIKKILSIVIFSFALISCGGSNEVIPLTINVGSEGRTLDPQLATDSTTTVVNTFLQEGLTRLDVNSKKIVPGLAKSWDLSKDGLVWTFYLRDNIKWSNGDEITANDFKYAWLRALNPDTASEYAYMLFPIKNAKEYNAKKVKEDEIGIKVINDKTLEVTLNSVTPYFTSLTSFLTYLPVNEKFIKKVGSEFSLEADKILYSGPYKMVDWVHNAEMKLEKNENYYDKDIISDHKVVLKFIADSTAALNIFKNDELDVVALSSEQYEKFKDDKRLHLVEDATIWYLGFNHMNSSVLKNRKIRKAILQAIDKEKLVEIATNGISKDIYNITPTGVGIEGFKTNDFALEVGETFSRFNKEEAKKLLKEGMRELNIDKMPTLSLIVNDGGVNKKFGEIIQEDLRKNLSIDINVELVTFKERLARTNAGDFDIVLRGWNADYKDPLTFLDLFVTNGGNNSGKYSNKEYDESIRIAQTEKDPKKRFEALKKAEKIAGEDVIVAILHQPKKLYLVNPRVSNYAFYGIGVKFDFTRAKVKE